MGNIQVTTEYEESLTLKIVGDDGQGHYAVSWDAGENYMAGQFCDFEDNAELYLCYNDGDTFSCEDGSELVATKNQDGGFSWEAAK